MPINYAHETGMNVNDIHMGGETMEAARLQVIDYMSQKIHTINYAHETGMNVNDIHIGGGKPWRQQDSK